MKRNVFAPLLMVGAFLTFLPNETNALAGSGYGGGSGTENDPYLISTPEHLNQLQLDANVNGVDTKGKYYRLINDIDLSGYDNDADETNGNFTPIGRSMPYSTFAGTFDGNGYKISTLEINLPSEDYVGLFGITTGIIKKLGLDNVVIDGNQYVGGLSARQFGGTVSQCYVTGSVNGNVDVGGLVGAQYNNGLITQSYSKANVNNGVGGHLLGLQHSGEVSQSYSIGGLIGERSPWAPDIEQQVVNSSYWNKEISTLGSSVGGTELTTAQMTGENAKTNMTGFDFDTIWKTTDSYPKLQWEKEALVTYGEKDVLVNGIIEETILSLTIPTSSINFTLNPNQEAGQQFIASGFELTNEGYSPLTLEIKSFEQVTDILNDVEPTKYADWVGLNKEESKDIALALVPKVGESWLSLNEGNRWVANLGSPVIGTMKGNSTVSFGFEAKHGSSFTETLTPQYKLTFVFGLQD